jgi:hypothetical protein
MDIEMPAPQKGGHGRDAEKGQSIHGTHCEVLRLTNALESPKKSLKISF